LATSQTISLTGASSTALAHLSPGLTTDAGPTVTSSNNIIESVGTLNVTGTTGDTNTVALGANSSLDIAIKSTVTTASIDLLNINGGLSINPSSALLTLSLLSDAADYSQIGLQQYEVPGAKLILAQWTTSETSLQLGTFADIVTPSGTYAAANGDWAQIDGIGFQIHYDLGNNDIYLSVPEPSTWTLLALGLGFLFLALRKRLRLSRTTVASTSLRD
jgi:hypothetical protein